MAKVHWILQGKGGVGKSLVAAFLAQFKLSKAVEPLCIDTDPVNATFSGFKALAVRRLQILEADEIDSRRFDTLIEWIAPAKHDVIVDTGAVAFVPLAHYLITNEVPRVLEQLGHELLVHTVVTGGPAMLDTLNGFAELLRQFPDPTRFVVWLNPYWGPIQRDGKGFEAMKAYTTAKDRVSALVPLPTVKAETFGRDVREMLEARLTFDEALEQTEFSIMTRQRLKIVRDQIFAQLELASAVL